MSTLASPRQHILPPLAPETVIDRICDAAAAPELWDATLAAIADSLGSTSAILAQFYAGLAPPVRPANAAIAA